MPVIQKKASKKRLWYSKITFSVLLLLVLFFARATWNIYSKERESARNLSDAQHQLASLEAQTDTANQDVARLSTPEGIEEELRSKYSITKPGESLVVIVEPQNATTASSTDNQNESFWQKFLDLFKSKQQ